MSRQLIGEADCFSKRNSDQKFADISKQDVIRILQKFLTYKRRWPCNFWSEICLVNARSNQASLVLNLLADLLRILISSLQNSVFIFFFSDHKCQETAFYIRATNFSNIVSRILPRFCEYFSSYLWTFWTK